MSLVGAPPNGNGRRIGGGAPQNFRKYDENLYKILVFGALEGHPGVPHTRAVILVVGNPWGMLPKPSFDEFSRFLCGG